MATSISFDLDTTLGGDDGAISYTENGAAVLVAPNATVSATGNFDTQKLTISGLLAEDQIGFASGVALGGNILSVGGVEIGAFAGGTGGADLVITFNSNATAAEVQTLLNNLTFVDESDNPNGSQSLTFNLAGVSHSAAVTVVAENDAPEIFSNGGGADNTTVLVAENTNAVTTVQALDADSANLIYSVVGGADAAKFTIDPVTGTLSFVDSPDFETPTDSNLNNIYSVIVGVSDGVFSDTQLLRVAVTNVNDAPTLDLNGAAAGTSASITYTANDGAKLIAPAALVTDPDAGSDLNHGSLRISFTQNGAVDDQLRIVAGGGVTRVGNEVRVGGVTIGTVSGGNNGADLLINFNGAASTARVTSLLEHIGYSNSSDNPSTLTRTVTFTVIDGDGTGNGGQDTATATATINVLPANHAPEIFSNGGGFDNTTVLVAENTKAVTTVQALDADSNPLTYSIVGGADASKFTIDAATGVLSFISAPNFESSTDASHDNVYAVVVGVTDGTLSDSQLLKVTVTNVNEAPVLDLNGASAGTSASITYAAKDPVTLIAPAAIVTDVEKGSDLNQGSLRVSFTENGTSSDQLKIVAGGGVTLAGNAVRVGGVTIGTVSGGTDGSDLVISFTGQASTARVTTLLEHIGYSNSADAPSTLPRTVTFTVIDGDGTANGGNDTGTATATINFEGADVVAPTVVVSAQSLTLSAGQTDLVTFTFSEAVSGFDNSDVNVTGGTLGQILQVDATHYSALFTPDATDALSASIQVLASGTGSSSWTDAATNPGQASNVLTITGDTLAPTAAVAISAIADDTGTSSSDFVTSDTSLTVSGTNEALGAGEKVQVSTDGATWFDVTPTDATSWTYVDPATHDANFTYQVRVVDAAGNVGNSANQAVTIDAAAPTAAVAISEIADDTGGSSNDFVTSDTSLTVSGTNDALGADEKVQVSTDGTTWFDVTPTDTTHWSYTDPATHDVDFTYQVRVVDAVGNVGNGASQAITIDTAAPVADVAISAITDDTGSSSSDFLTSDTSLTVSGSNDALGAGEKVQVSTDGATWFDVTPTDTTHWSYTDPATHDVDFTYQVRVVDAVGNVGNGASQAITIDTAAPVADVAISAITDDTGSSSSDFLTNDTSLTVSGSNDALGAGEKVQVSTDGATWFDVTPTDTTHWSYTDPATHDVDFTYQVRVVDTAGNVGNGASQAVTIDTAAPELSITLDTITADNVLDNTEAANGKIAVTGTVGGDVHPGDTVTLTVNGNPYTGAVDAGGAFSIDVPGSELADDADSTVEASVTVTDAAGNATTSTDSQTYSVTPLPAGPSITLNAITLDNVVNAAEAAGTVAVTGTVGGDVQNGDTVTLLVNGTIYGGNVANGAFSIDVLGSDLAGDSDKTVDASVTSVSATATDTQLYGVDTVAPAASITLSPIAADDVVNISEANGDVAVTGTVGGEVQDGDIVTLTVNGNTYTGAVNSGGFSINVPGSALVADADTTVDASVTTTDAAGNEGTAITSRDYSVDTDSPAAGISVDVIATDGVVDAAEAQGDIAVTGTVSGDVHDGDIVTLTVNGVTHTGSVSGGGFSINVAGSDLVADFDSTVDASVTTTDTAGNGATATDTQTYVVDVPVALPSAIISLNSVTPDNVINIAEAGGTVAVTGTVDGDVQNGDIVTLTVHGVAYMGAVSGGGFSINVAGTDLVTDSDLTIDASVTASNSATATATQTYTLDTVAPAASIALNAITADNTINFAESGGNVAVTGTIGGDVHNGDIVSLSVNGTVYTGAVSAGAFSIGVAGSDLAADADKTVDASVTAMDAAGNSTTATDTRLYTVDVQAPTATITLNPVTSDNVINIAESQGNVAITGSIGGDAHSGDTVTLNVNGANLTGQVDAGGNFSIVVAGSALALDPDTTIAASVTTTDAAGNSTTGTANKPYALDLAAPAATISLNAITADNKIDVNEAAGQVAVSGTVGPDLVQGDEVFLSINNNNSYSGMVQADGTFSILVLGSDLAADADLRVEASATATDGAGNSTIATAFQEFTLLGAPFPDLH